jgi:hypothetical protein
VTGAARTLLVVLVALVAAHPAGGAQGSGRPLAWATINVCDPPDHPGAVGVRVAIGRRAGRPEQWARVRMQYFDDTRRAWRGVASGGDGSWARIGNGRRDVTGGTTFVFAPPSAGRRLVLRGVAYVEWRRHRRVVARMRVFTTAGHQDPADPALAISQRSCEIRR